MKEVNEVSLRHRGGYHQLEQEVRTRYHVELLHQHCRALCIDREGCAENRKTIFSDGPMIHLSADTRVRVWQKLGLAIGSNPVITENHAEIDPFRYEPVAVECARPGCNCLLDCIHHLFTGTTDHSTRLQELLAEQQRMQVARFQSLFYPLFNPGQTVVQRGILETDFHVLAEMLEVHLQVSPRAGPGG